MKATSSIITLMLVCITLAIAGCTAENGPQAISGSGVQQATVSVATDAQGHTVEQNNIIARYKMDNDPSTIRFVYVISPYDHKVILKTTMKGKVTSSGKRLTPNTVSELYAESQSYNVPYANIANIGGHRYITSEIEQDDGTYGSSTEYLYGFNLDGSMMQIYTGGALVLVSTKPLTIQDGTINMQYVDAEGNPVTDSGTSELKTTP